jgi:hypothetical protein|nr:MAG TPA: hypothetical protein [Bacteriophage sp.]DAX06045.1 MAG TPA: hypothetical protein [Bacteriophage sp.]
MAKDYVDNKIILRSVYGKVGQKYTLQPCKDRVTGQYPDCVKYVDSKGDMIMTDAERNSGKVYIPENFSITFESGKEFNLDNPIERAQWEAIKNCSLIAKTIDQKDKNGNYVLSRQSGIKYSAAELYVERPGYETSKKVSRREKIHTAETYVFNDPEGADGRLKMARLLGRNLRNAPDADIKEYLLDIASKDPDKIINLYTGEDLVLRVLFMDAKDKDVIYSKNRVYIYGDGIPLGGTIDAVLAWMRDPRNSKMLALIKRDTYGDELEVTNPNAVKALDLE